MPTSYTTDHQIPYPTEDEPFAGIDEHLYNLAVRIDAELTKAKPRTGKLSSGAHVAGTARTNANGVFANPFPVGVTPTVTLTIADVGNPNGMQVAVTAGSVTNTGFSWQSVRAAGTGAFDVYYSAVAS